MERRGARCKLWTRPPLAPHTHLSFEGGRLSNTRFKLLRQADVDTAPDAELSRTEAQLRATARQQEAVAHLGQRALAGAPLDELLAGAVTLAARVLEVPFASLLELRPESRTLLLRAGVGWRDGAVGRTVVPADADSHAGYVLRSTGQVVVEDLATDTRFGQAPLLRPHGIVSSLSVLVYGPQRPFGILGVHTTSRRAFAIHDTHFLQAVANVLATAIERRRAEDALRRSEEHFRSLIENASDIVTIVGENGVFRYASPSVERVLGYRPAELLERSAFDYVHPDDIAVVGEALARAIREPARPQTAQFRFRARDGSWRALEAVGQARVEPGGATAQLIVNARDVTERRRQERALRENKERLRTVIAGAPLVLFALDRHGVFTMVEGRALDAVGVRAGVLIGRSAFELYADLPQALADVRRALAGESFSSVVEVFGVVFESWYSPVRDADGVVTGVIGVGTDITERRRAEEALRRSEESHRTLVQHASYGIYRSSVAGRFLTVNPALVNMLGYASEHELLAVDLGTQVYADPEERRRILSRFDTDDVIEGAEVTWKRKEGERILVRLSGRAVRRADGTIEAFETIAENVTERRALETQLRQSQKMEAIGQLTGGIAHDFNNLLTIILANTQLLGKALSPDQTHAQADLRDVMAAALRGRVMVKELLGFARRSTLDLQPVRLDELVSELSGLLRRVLPAYVELVIRGKADGPEVRADVHAVEQILFNLVTNARDAMPEGGVLRIETSRVQLSEEQRRAWGAEGPAGRDYVCLAVGDTGVGMDDETRAHMFEPFFTTKPAGKGTGLGLATVYGLAKQHGAGIEVESQVGKGTRFRIYFPAVAGELGEEQPRPMAEVDVRGGHETILIVEDDDQLRRSAKRILEEAGYQVVSTADGLEALDALRHTKGVRLVFSDLVMPRLGGRALLDAARRAGYTTPFLFASGYSDPDRAPTRDKSLPMLEKPWTGPDLLRKVREILDSEQGAGSREQGAGASGR
ncbi:MAG TPA: PAS domain S-box protein [Gemmatimonadales bacterium]|nr:PAS domain S-box protein [Gemmatimonadales bacterium]